MGATKQGVTWKACAGCESMLAVRAGQSRRLDVLLACWLVYIQADAHKQSINAFPKYRQTFSIYMVAGYYESLYFYPGT